MSDYQHAVLFEAKNLSDGDMRKIRNYFQIRRQSGGGDCGEVERVEDNAYKISFLHKEAQERVLSKTDHIINLPGGGSVHILIKHHDNKEEKEVLPHSTSDQQDSGNTPMQKVFKLDPYLLRYLKDNSRAKSDLEEQLSSLLSTFSLDMVTETVVVMRDAVQTDQNIDVQQKWEAKLDIVLSEIQDRYIIHFEVESKRLEILNKNSALFPQNFEFYEEEGLYVIVGENKEVKKFLKVIDTLQLRQQARKECPVSKTRYSLVKERFEREIKSKFSNIDIATEEQHGRLVLKGPEDQIHSAATKLQEFLNQIQEKKIPLPRPLKAFMSSTGVIQNFQTRFQQNLCSPVLLEDTGFGLDLVLLSLSTGALQEAVIAIQRDLCVEMVLLEQAESKPPGIDTLKNTLTPVLQQANRGTSKVEISYEPRTASDPRMKVQLVGYSTEVSKLKNIIQNYKQDYVEYSDTVTLPVAEMVDNFSELLSLLGVADATDVNLMATSLPIPRVHLSGPRCKVIDMKKTFYASLNHLVWRKISVDGPGVLQFFQDEGGNTQELLQKSCQVLISLKNNVLPGASASPSTAFTSLPIMPSPVSHPGHCVALEIVFGGLEDQQVDVLVAPMLNTNLTSTIVGKSILNKAGQQFNSHFDAAKGRCRISPGDVLVVDATKLGCRKVFFIECVPWTGNTHSSEQTLRCGIRRALELCEQQALSSIAFPVIGPGVALGVPVQNAASILTGEIGMFGLSGPTTSLKTIRIVIMPNYPNSEEIYQAVHSGLNAIVVDHRGQAAFQSLSSEIDEITIPLAGCQVHLIFGDISNETTDVIVNTTDFTDLQTDVCNDILTVAGPQVMAALTGVQVKRGDIFVTQPGGFPCKAIMHVCGERNTDIIKKMTQDILLQCEHSGYKSVAIPAICAGKGGLDAQLVARAILQGVKDATVQAILNNVKIIHIVLMKVHVFLEFKAMAKQIFGTSTQVKAPLLRVISAAPPSLTLDLSSLVQCLPDQSVTAEFLVMGLTDVNVSRACQELEQAYRRQCSSHSVSQDELKHLTPAEVDNIIKNVTSLGIQIRQQGPDGLTVSGLTKGVNEFIRLVQGTLVRQVREKEQDDIFSRTSWCILGSRGIWERLPKQAHHQLENRNVGGGILDAQGQKWTVNLAKMKATAIGASAVANIKRLENMSDFCIPLYWDNMTTGEVLKVVPLHPSSAEYKRVKSDFKRTVTKAVMKIERIQNVHLRRAYEVRKTELQNKNGTVGAGERSLYHGTTADASASIQHSNFNRRFAGQNGTMYGLGTYFAVDASYSASPIFSVASTDGTQCMFVTLVLTGHYTQGKNDMTVPPPRSSQDPNDRFDSVVDNMQNPSMFVVFHDCQAYPDYLITFK